jgi:hypothetical protein
MSNPAPVPIATAVLFADRILIEAGTNKKTLVGIYSSICARRLPVRRKLNAYVELVDAYGQYEIGFELVHLESETVAAHGVLPGVQAPDRLLPVEMVLRFGTSFDLYGAYEFRLRLGSNVFASRTIRVSEAPTPRPANKGPENERGG